MLHDMEGPTGTVTFLFTDIEGSTRLREETPAAMGAALARHDAILEEAQPLRPVDRRRRCAPGGPLGDDRALGARQPARGGRPSRSGRASAAGSRPTDDVFQLGEHSFAPLRSLDSFPGNLPVQLTSFVGRQGDLATLAEALGTARLVTLTGTGGVGKTRLAVQAAADARRGAVQHSRCEVRQRGHDSHVVAPRGLLSGPADPGLVL